MMASAIASSDVVLGMLVYSTIFYVIFQLKERRRQERINRDDSRRTGRNVVKEGSEESKGLSRKRKRRKKAARGRPSGAYFFSIP